MSQPSTEGRDEARLREARSFLRSQLGPLSAALLEGAAGRRVFLARLAAGREVEDAALGMVHQVGLRDREVEGEFLTFLHERLHAMAHRLLGPILRQREESLDLVQSVAEDVFCGSHDLEFRTLAEFLALLERRLRFKASDHLRRARADRRREDRRRELASDPAGQGPGPGTNAANREECELLERALACLRANERLAILMSDGGATAAEIGARLGMTPAAAQKHLERSRKRLRWFAERLHREGE